MSEERGFTPREIVSELDRFIVGQNAAKRAVAIALRNRWRRKRVPPPLKDEIAPKNILLMGPTGSGKTEIARRLAKLAQAPFVKVEATKFTEVGYVGRDVDSMVRDLVDVALKMAREEATARVAVAAKDHAEERVLDLLLPTRGDSTREKLRRMLRDGELSDREVEVDVTTTGGGPVLHMFQQPGMEDMASSLQDALSGAFGGGNKKKRRKMKVAEALDVLAQEEAQKLLDQDQVQRDAVVRAEQAGIIFIDEIDKIATSTAQGRGPDVSREGVQRDILPIVEGSTVNTKYGPVKTDHVLFICAGAFHMSKPSDLIPELQGRLPIRVELEPLTEADFVRILTEPENSLVKQYKAMLATEGVDLVVTDDGVKELARVAAAVNASQENIGARRLYTIMERLVDDVSYTAPDRRGEVVRVDAAYVRERLDALLVAEDLGRYIL